jgi:hypothetical protein
MATGAERRYVTTGFIERDLEYVWRGQTNYIIAIKSLDVPGFHLRDFARHSHPPKKKRKEKEKKHRHCLASVFGMMAVVVGHTQGPRY